MENCPDETDNRASWATALRADFSVELGTPAKTVIAWYLSISDGTGQVERDLGCLARMMQSHCGANNPEHLSALVELHMDGPKQESDLAVRISALSPAGEILVGLSMTPFSRRCLQIWRKLHGSRFNSYERHIGPRQPPAPSSKVTEALISRRQTTAINSLYAASKRGTSGRSSLIPGVTRQELSASSAGRLQKSSRWNPSLAKFHERTQLKVKQRLAEKQNRRCGNMKVERPTQRRAALISPALPKEAASSSASVMRRSVVAGFPMKVAVAAGGSVAAGKRHYQVKRLESRVGHMLSDLDVSSVVIFSGDPLLREQHDDESSS